MQLIFMVICLSKKKRDGTSRQYRPKKTGRGHLTLSFISILTGIPSTSWSRTLMTTSVTVWSGKTPVVLPLSDLLTFGILTVNLTHTWRPAASAKVQNSVRSFQPMGTGKRSGGVGDLKRTARQSGRRSAEQRQCARKSGRPMRCQAVGAGWNVTALRHHTPLQRPLPENPRIGSTETLRR